MWHHAFTHLLFSIPDVFHLKIWLIYQILIVNVNPIIENCKGCQEYNHQAFEKFFWDDGLISIHGQSIKWNH